MSQKDEGGEMTRAEHLAWCKERALEYVDTDPVNAWTSLVSDLGKHPETVDHMGIGLGVMELIRGGLSTPKQMRNFIEGFN